ncbi:hypothetical protein L6452_04737 [Arctium lappa]|uniref:Uncharacterized protein n=1 Tax=Arctium lappa TaxID=4217 RepID=A0ACB9EF21_ARCLA|nr:hypothetical protein L6452_04737 [Arctium lappa]
MKSNCLSLFLVVFFALVVMSYAARAPHATFQFQNKKPEGNIVVKAEKLAEPNNQDRCWPYCKPPMRGRRL